LKPLVVSLGPTLEKVVSPWAIHQSS